MSQQSEMADSVYSQLGNGPIPMARLVRELRDRWGSEFGVSSVHGFVRVVASCLVDHEDVEVGDLKEGRFVGWRLDPWDADHKIDEELMAMDSFLEDESRYLFRKKQSP